MTHLPVRLAATAVVVAVLVFPGGLSAKAKKGADLVVTRLDGSRVAGELIAVKSDSILILTAEGRDESLDLSAIKTVRVVRHAHSGKSVLYAGIAGAVCGAGVWLALPTDLDPFEKKDSAAFIVGGLVGGVAALAAWGISSLGGIDSTFPVAGEPYDVVWSQLNSLRARTREPVLPGGRREGRIRPEAKAPPVPGKTIPEPVPTTAAGGRLAHGPRFRITLPVTFGAERYLTPDRPVEASFRLVGFAEEGPYLLSLERHDTQTHSTLPGSISLAYELTGKWAAEIEVLFAGWQAGWSGSEYLSFTPASNGGTYHANDRMYFNVYAKYSAVLAGLTYRPFPPSLARHHVFEAGLAAGPGWARFFPATRKRIGLSARAHVAYDFYFLPEFSVGAALGYRFLSTSSVETTRTFNLTYSNYLNTSDPMIDLDTRITIPPTRISASGTYFSLRLGVRF